MTLDTILSFAPCDRRQCAEVVIMNDVILEETESLFVILTRVPGLDTRITLNPVDAEIEIIDDDGTIYSYTCVTTILTARYTASMAYGRCV